MNCIIHGVAKSQTWLSDFHFHYTSEGNQKTWTKYRNHGYFRVGNKELLTHSSTLTWQFHGQEKPGGYCPWGHKKLVQTQRLNINNNYQIRIGLQWGQRMVQAFFPFEAFAQRLMGAFNKFSELKDGDQSSGVTRVKGFSLPCIGILKVDTLMIKINQLVNSSLPELKYRIKSNQYLKLD